MWFAGKKEVKKETKLRMAYKKDDNFGEWYSEARLLSNFWVAGDGQAVVGFSRPYTAVNYRHNVFTVGGIRISELVVDARLLNWDGHSGGISVLY